MKTACACSCKMVNNVWSKIFLEFWIFVESWEKLVRSSTKTMIMSLGNQPTTSDVVIDDNDSVFDGKKGDNWRVKRPSNLWLNYHKYFIVENLIQFIEHFHSFPTCSISNSHTSVVNCFSFIFFRVWISSFVFQDLPTKICLPKLIVIGRLMRKLFRLTPQVFCKNCVLFSYFASHISQLIFQTAPTYIVCFDIELA